MKDLNEELTGNVKDYISTKLFNKPYDLLQFGEMRDVDDFISTTKGMNDATRNKCLKLLTDPIWKEHPDYYAEFSSNGIQVRDSVTKEPIEPFIWGRYMNIILRSKKTGKLEPVSLHKQIALLFVPNPDPDKYDEIHHINSDRFRNWPWNLQWSDRKTHIGLHALMGTYMGENNSQAKYTEYQIKHACKLLQDHPDWTYNNIGELTGVAWHTVRDIYQHNEWTHISKDYHFPKRETTSYYKKSQIHQVCELLQNSPDLTFDDIAARTGVSKSVVGGIFRHELWNTVSVEYKFPPRPKRDGESSNHSIYTEDQVRQVCDLLDKAYLGEEKVSHKDIADIAGVKRSLVDDIYSKRAWTQVAKNYKFYNRPE